MSSFLEHDGRTDTARRWTRHGKAERGSRRYSDSSWAVRLHNARMRRLQRPELTRGSISRCQLGESVVMELLHRGILAGPRLGKLLFPIGLLVLLGLAAAGIGWLLGGNGIVPLQWVVLAAIIGPFYLLLVVCVTWDVMCVIMNDDGDTTGMVFPTISVGGRCALMLVSCPVALPLLSVFLVIGYIATMIIGTLAWLFDEQEAHRHIGRLIDWHPHRLPWLRLWTVVLVGAVVTGAIAAVPTVTSWIQAISLRLVLQMLVWACGVLVVLAAGGVIGIVDGQLYEKLRDLFARSEPDDYEATPQVTRSRKPWLRRHIRKIAATIADFVDLVFCWVAASLLRVGICPIIEVVTEDDPPERLSLVKAD